MEPDEAFAAVPHHTLEDQVQLFKDHCVMIVHLSSFNMLLELVFA